MPRIIQEELVLLIQRCLNIAGWEEFYPEKILLDLPTDNRFGDFTTNLALKLTKRLKRPPQEIAAKLADLLRQEILKTALKDLISEIKIEGVGFLNFYLSQSYYYDQLNLIIAQGKEALKINLGQDKKVLIEFVSAKIGRAHV